MTYQDIHLEDRSLWEQLKTAWEDGNYSSVINTLGQSAFSGKKLTASVINSITMDLGKLQSQKDTSFKSDKIKIAVSPPSGLAIGEVYFRNIGDSTGYSESGTYVEPTQKTASGYDVLNLEIAADNIMLSKDTIAAFGLDKEEYTLDEALYDAMRLLGILG